MQDLLNRFIEGPERGGVIKKDGTIVELDNWSTEPADSYAISPRDIHYLYSPDTVATWHTHPGTFPNLSPMDMKAFLNWPNLLHYIVSRDKVLCYKVIDGKVVLDEENCFTRLLEKSS